MMITRIEQTQLKLLASVFLFCAALFFTSCTRSGPQLTSEQKLRGLDEEEPFVPNTDDNIYSVSKFKVIDIPSAEWDDNLLQGKTIKIKTAEKGKPVKVSISMAGAFINPDSNVSFWKQYQVLDYEVLGAETHTPDQKLLAELLRKIEFTGFPGTVYDIVPYLADNYLILYRVSDPQKVPPIEIPIALKAGAKVATPLIGYPIKYCKKEKQLNSNNEETGYYIPKCENVPKKSAAFLHLSRDNWKPFNYDLKVDIFPRDFLEGEWFFIKTVVKSSKDQATGFHQDFRLANIVEFEKAPDYLKAVDASAYQMDEKDKPVNFFIPIEWKEYKVDQDAGFIHKFREKENNQTKNVDRPYFKIKFKDLVNNETQQGNSVAELENVVAELEENVFITDDYFSFTIKKQAAHIKQAAHHKTAG